MTGTYRLQQLVARQNQNAPDKTCKLCLTADEDMGHFLLDCPVTEGSRGGTIEAYAALLGAEKVESTGNEREILIQIILDCRVLGVGGQVSDPKQISLAARAEKFSRDLINSLHRDRWSRLQRLARTAPG